MKIVFYAHYWAPQHFAGSELFGQNLLKYLQSRGHEVQVVAVQEYDAPQTWDFDGISVIRPIGLETWSDVLKQTNPDVILTHHHPTPYAQAFALQQHIPVVQIIHNNHGVADQYLSGGGDMIIYNTEYLQNQFQAKYPQYKSVVLHPPVFAEQHATTPGDMVTLINLNEHKGSKILYELANRMPDVQFLAVEGGHGIQIYEQWDNITFQAQTTDMKNDVWARTKVLLMPSIYESYGMVGVEAMASGIPVIANPTFGLQESLGYAGTFVNRDSVSQWEEEIRRLLNNNHLWERKSKLAKRRSAQLDPYVELASVADKIEELIDLGIRNSRRR